MVSNTLKSTTKVLKRVCAFVVVMLGLSASSAMANPESGGECTACHQSSTLPKTHIPIANLDRTQCLACHQIKSSASAAPLESTVQNQDQEREQIQKQDRVQEQQRQQDQDRKQVQTMIGSDGPARQEHRGQQSDGHANRAHDGAFDPLSFRAYFGLLSSSNIEQHRSNSLFHGSSEASFYQPGASGGEGSQEAVSGNRLHLGARADYQVDLGDRTTLTYGFRLLHDEFLAEDYNRSSARLSVRWKTHSGPEMWQITSYLQSTVTGGADEEAEEDFNEVGATLNYHRTLSDNLTAIAAVRARQRDFEGETSEREPDFSLSFGMRQAVRDVGLFSYGLAYIDRNSARRDHSRYQGPSVYASFDRAVSDTMTIGLTGEIGTRSYDASKPDTTTVRRDEYGEIGISVRDSRLKVLSSTPEFSCRYNRTTSNIDQFDSDGALCAISIEKRF